MKTTIQSRIEQLSSLNQKIILSVIQLLEDREAKHEEVEPEDITDQSTPPIVIKRKADHVDSVTWDNNFTWMRFGIALGEHRYIDKAVGALQAVQDRIDEDDYQTKGMISCIEAYLQVIYETLQDRHVSTVRAFNNCYPNEAINE